MGIDSPQRKKGVQFLPDNRSSDKGSPQSDPLANDGSGTSTHHKFRSESVKENKGGKIIEGQKLRGYVLDPKNTNIGAVDDATVAPDGTNRVKKLG